jgi:acyl-coenzyme A synthetase/AMP-(fatty) acid ligase
MSAAYNMEDYGTTYAEFAWRRPASFNFARDVIDAWAAENPEKLAMLWVDDAGSEERRTYAQFSRASGKLCNVLSGEGVRRGDVVIVMLGRRIEWWEVLTACLRMGAVAAPATLQLTAKDIEYRVNAAEAACFITDAAHAAKLEAVAKTCPSLKSRILVGGQREGWTAYSDAVAKAVEDFPAADTASDENAICYFTSGTTGYPKMAMHTHASYPLAHETTGRFWLDQRPSDLHWNISDTGWAKAAWSSYFGPWYCGSAVFVHHTEGFDPVRTLQLLQRYPITTVCGAPTLYRMLVLQDLAKYRFPALRHCVGAGEPLNPEVIATWKEMTGLTIRDGYGQTETVLLCGSFPCLEPRPGSMGKPAPGIDLRVIDGRGNLSPPHTEGELAVRIRPERPLGLFKEYWRDPERTAASFQGDWYLTGDRAYVDDEGYFWFVGRSDDVILSSGYRIGPFEVESALLEHPAVAESAVVSSPDETRGEVVKAFVILAPGYEGSDALRAELQKHVKNVTAPYKYPRSLEFVETLPKTVSGKIRRVELREREWGSA